jgi:serine/threonine protein kinase
MKFTVIMPLLFAALTSTLSTNATRTKSTINTGSTILAHRPIGFKDYQPSTDDTSVRALLENIRHAPTMVFSTEFNRQYSVKNVLGNGGFCVILRATHLTDGKDVAIKIGHPSYSNTMSKEAAILANAQQNNVPNMLTILDSGMSNGCFYLV